MYLKMASAAQNAVLDDTVVLDGHAVHQHAVYKLYVGTQSAIRAQHAALYRAALSDANTPAEHTPRCDGGFRSDRGRLVPEIAVDVRFVRQKLRGKLRPEQIPGKLKYVLKDGKKRILYPLLCLRTRPT